MPFIWYRIHLRHFVVSFFYYCRGGLGLVFQKVVVSLENFESIYIITCSFKQHLVGIPHQHYEYTNGCDNMNLDNGDSKVYVIYYVTYVFIKY